MTSVFDRIGSLAERLRARVGRPFGNCRTCGNPTRSHRLGDGFQCHTCHVEGRNVALADGGRDVPPARQCVKGTCEREAIDPTDPAGLCEECRAQVDQDQDQEDDRDDRGVVDDVDQDQEDDRDGRLLDHVPPGTWADADTAPDRDVFPPAHCEREQWMGHTEKKPFAPWSPLPAENSREWGDPRNYSDFDTAKMGAVDPRVDGLAFIQREDDPFLHLDGDNVVCPDTGAIHPAFVAFVEHLGLSYADISTSFSGAHVLYRGEVPEYAVEKDPSWVIDDEPWGANDEGDLPSIEIYSGKRVCVMTGRHIPSTPAEVRPIDDDALDAILEANGKLEDQDDDQPDPDDVEPFDVDEYEPEATSRDETTGNVKDILAALDRLDARRVADRTIVHEWNDDASTSGNYRAFSPTWGRSSNGTANIVDDRIWQDTGDEAGYGGPAVMAAIDAGLISHRDATGGVSGDTFWQAVDHLRDLGFNIPEWDSDAALPEWLDEWVADQPLVDRDDVVDEGFDGLDQVSLLPLSRLDSLQPDEVRRYAKKRDLDWPTTDEARQRLEDRLFTAMRHQENVVLDAPTALGKSHTGATTPWRQHTDMTGDQPVIQFSETREARDQSVAKSKSAGVSHRRLLGREEACSCAAGDHDPVDDEDREDPDRVVTMNGDPPSNWFDMVCNTEGGRGLPFSLAHSLLAEHNDQGYDDLPCQLDDEGNPCECRAIAQWEGIPRDDDGNPAVDVIHATHQFAHVPGLGAYTNMIFDERPDFTIDLSTDQVRRHVTAFLKATDAPVSSWERFVTLARDAYGANPHGDLVSEREAVVDAFDEELERDWYIEAENAHALAPALAKAVWWALSDEPTSTGRYATTVPHEPPRLDANARDDEGWNREWVSVVIDEDHEIQSVRCAPDLSNARSVIGLDAHPCMKLWERNTHPEIVDDELLDARERALWRRCERGLLVAQVGDADRPLTSGEYFDEGGTRATIEDLHDGFDDEFRTTITAAAVEDDTREIMRDVGIDDPETMHYGEEKSRDDFSDERVGLVNGCIDPGDGYVLDLLAECGCDAEPETTDQGERAHGRGFVGPDADTARDLLASVRENHVAQAAGRYARNADDPHDHALVFVRTAAVPSGFADLQVPGVEWVATDLQRQIVEALRDEPGATARDLAETVDCSKKHVADTLSRLADADLVRAREGAGDYGATVYRLLADDAPSGLVDLGPTEQIANDSVWDSYTWSFAIDSPSLPTHPRISASRRASSGPARKQSSLGTFDRGDRPPNDAD